MQHRKLSENVSKMSNPLIIHFGCLNKSHKHLLRSSGDVTMTDVVYYNIVLQLGTDTEIVFYILSISR